MEKSVHLKRTIVAERFIQFFCSEKVVFISVYMATVRLEHYRAMDL